MPGNRTYEPLEEGACSVHVTLTLRPRLRENSFTSAHWTGSEMPSSSRLPELVLLLSICLTLIQCQEIKYIAVSADVTFHFGPCELNQVYKLQYSGVTAHIPCNSIHQIPLRFGDRISIDKTTGSITLRNVTSSDAGYYRLVRTNGNGKNENLPSVEVRVLDPIWIHELFHNYTDGTISLSRCHAENSGVISWMIDGRDLLDRRWLSPDNRTLTIPYNYTGVITVSNLVSTDNKSITVIGDLNGESGNLGPVMDLSITTVIWGDGRDEPTKGTLILPRNISAIYILLTQSDETSETQWRSWKRFIYIAVMVVLIMLVIVCLFMDSLMRDEFPLLSFISKMNFLPMNHVTRKNVTLLQMDDAENSELWEPQTVIVVVIFGLVCVLHLTAFLYTVCLQSYVNGGAQTFPHPFHYRRQDKEKNVFYGLISPIFIDHEDSQTKERIPIMVDI